MDRSASSIRARRVASAGEALSRELARFSLLWRASLLASPPRAASEEELDDVEEEEREEKEEREGEARNEQAFMEDADAQGDAKWGAKGGEHRDAKEVTDGQGVAAPAGSLVSHTQPQRHAFSELNGAGGACGADSTNGTDGINSTDRAGVAADADAGSDTDGGGSGGAGGGGGNAAAAVAVAAAPVDAARAACPPRKAAGRAGGGGNAGEWVGGGLAGVRSPLTMRETPATFVSATSVSATSLARNGHAF